MSGLLRNLLTLIQAVFASGRPDPWSRVSCYFWVSPFDCGTSVLKSDKYLQLAEAAQLDFLVKTGLIGRMVRQGCRFVNAAQLVRFMKPIAMFKRVRVDTAVVYADERCAYFSHALFVRAQLHGEVLVKMKFKSGQLTVRPENMIGACPRGKPCHIQAWEQALAQMQKA